MQSEDTLIIELKENLQILTNENKEINTKLYNINTLTSNRWKNIDIIIQKFYILIIVLISLQMLSILIFCIFVS